MQDVKPHHVKSEFSLNFQRLVIPLKTPPSSALENTSKGRIKIQRASHQIAFSNRFIFSLAVTISRR